MAKPFPLVEISFAGTPYDASPAWVDVTSYVRSVTTHRGRSGDTEFETGTAQVVLDNRSRLFDPFYTGGTYYGQLIPRKQIRVRSTIGATTYDVFRGYITGWPVQYTDAGFDSTVTLQCYDAFGLLNDDHLPENWTTYLMNTSILPGHYFICNDPEGAVLTDTGTTPANLKPTTSVFKNFTEYDSLAQGLVGTSADLSLTQYQGIIGTGTANTSDTTIIGWYALAYPDQNDAIITFAGNDGTTGTTTMKIYPNLPNPGQVYVLVEETGTGNTASARTIDININTFAPQHIAASYQGSTGAVKIYINGVDRTSTTTNYANIKLRPGRSITIEQAIFQELAIVRTDMSAADIKKLYEFGASARTESTQVRAQTVLATTSFPAGLIDTYPTTVYGECAEITNGGSIVPELNLIGATEGGYFFVTKAGKIKMTDRQYVFNNTNSNTTQATFSDVIPYVSLKYGTSLSLEYNSDDIGNVATVSLSGGGEVSSTNSTSVTSFGTKAYNIATQTSTVAGGQTLADWDVTLRSKLRATVSPIEVSVTSESADWSTLLGLELLERFVVTRTPSVQIGQGTPTATGNAITQTMLINAIDHSITPGDWTMTLTGSTRYTGYFILDKSLLDGTDVLLG